MMDKIGDFLFFGGDFRTSRTVRTYLTFFGVGTKKRPDFSSRVFWVVGVDGFFLRYAAKALAR